MESNSHKIYRKRKNRDFKDTLLLKCLGVLERCDKFLQDAHIYEDLHNFGRLMTSNPILLSTCLMVVIAVLTPLLFFAIFAIINAIFAFAGFIIIQVTVLAVAASLLGCILFCVAITVGLIGMFIFFMYYSISYISRLLKIS